MSRIYQNGEFKTSLSLGLPNEVFEPSSPILHSKNDVFGETKTCKLGKKFVIIYCKLLDITN